MSSLMDAMNFSYSFIFSSSVKFDGGGGGTGKLGGPGGGGGAADLSSVESPMAFKKRSNSLSMFLLINPGCPLKGQSADGWLNSPQ